MAKVWFDSKTKEYVHENGQRILASDVRTTPHHRRKVMAMAGVDPHAPLLEPIPNEIQCEIKYVESILGDE